MADTQHSGSDRRKADRVGPPKVLVTDDSTATRRILTRTLVDAGYEVSEAADGREAIAVCREEPPDLILLDVDMPVMDGISALEEMKADDRLRHLPVLFLTARTSGSEVAEGLDLGAQDYLRKPCEPAELVARVAAALRVKAQEAALQRQAEELDHLSSTDTLTGLGNRRRLEAHLSKLPPDATASVLMVDVDHFKRINDNEGHAVGDLVLRVVTGRLLSAVQDRHLVVRWGGEEFVVLAVGADAAEAAELGESLRAVVSDTPFALNPFNTLVVTVSVGCASGSVSDLEQVLHAADEALYDAKRAGRNRVAVASR